MVNSQAFFLSKRIFFTILIVLFYRIGAYIPLPYGSVVTERMLSFFSSFNLLHGGALSRSSIFSLNIMPYIVSSVITQLIASGDRDYAADYAFSKKFKIRLLTMCLAFLQGFFLILSSGTLNNMISLSALLNLWSLVAGSLLLMWLGELITTHGIGNGISLIISAGIIAEMPTAISKHIRALNSSAVSVEQLLFSFIFILLLLSFIVFIESSVRSIPVNYAKQHFSAHSLAKTRSYIPLRVNTAGVIPPIFANAVLMLPITILGFYRNHYNIANTIADFLSPGKAMYECLYALLIVFFCFFYTFIVFDPEKAAENIKKGGGIIFGYRPGKDTAAYLRSVIGKLTVVGSVYVVIVCMSTELMRLANVSLFIIGGTSLLIIVGVVIDTAAQIQVHLFSGQYDKILQKTGLRRRG